MLDRTHVTFVAALLARQILSGGDALCQARRQLSCLGPTRVIQVVPETERM